MIPANLQSEATFLQSQVAQNAPIASAPQAQIIAMQLNATSLVNDATAALASAAGALDTWTAPAGATPIITGIQALVADAQNQSDIALFAGLVGRVKLTLDQIPP